MSQYLSRETRIENLKKAQTARKEDALERVHQAIKHLEKTGEKINFNTVARVANVSVSYLYKYPEIKQHIAQLRNKQSTDLSPLVKPVSSSHVKILGRLKERIQQLEAQNRELRRKNEALAGQVYRVHHLQQQVERQQETIKDLGDRLQACESRNSTPRKVSANHSNVTFLEKKRSKKAGDSDNIKSELEALNIKMNSTLLKLIEPAPPEVVFKAIDALKEALQNTNVRNPSGFLAEAIRNFWSPNEGCEQLYEKNAFDEWYSLAESKKLVSASINRDGVKYVLNSDEQWISFEKISAKYPLEFLRQMSEQEITE